MNSSLSSQDISYIQVNKNPLCFLKEKRKVSVIKDTILLCQNRQQHKIMLKSQAVSWILSTLTVAFTLSDDYMQLKDDAFDILISWTQNPPIRSEKQQNSLIHELLLTFNSFVFKKFSYYQSKVYTFLTKLVLDKVTSYEPATWMEILDFVESIDSLQFIFINQKLNTLQFIFIQFHVRGFLIL